MPVSLIIIFDIIFDSYTAMVEQHNLGQYLSKNTQNFMTKENDGDNLLRAVSEYVTAIAKGTKADDALRLAVPEDKSDALLNTLMRSPITLDYLKHLYSCGRLFRLTGPMTKRWMKTNINGTFGGVSDLFFYNIPRYTLKISVRCRDCS